MDILHLVDRLEELFNESRSVPFTHSVIVDEDRMLDIIDQMRISVPDEVKKAQDVFSKKDRVMAQAQEEATRTLQLARERADGLVEKELLVQDAKRRAEQIIDQAHEAHAEDLWPAVWPTRHRLDVGSRSVHVEDRDGVDHQKPARCTKAPAGVWISIPIS